MADSGTIAGLDQTTDGFIRYITNEDHELVKGDSVTLLNAYYTWHNRTHVVTEIRGHRTFVVNTPWNTLAPAAAGAFWSKDSADCAGGCHECRDCDSWCLTEIVHRWRGDLAFSQFFESGESVPSLSQFERHHHGVVDWQEPQTNLIARIRLDVGNLDWFNELAAASLLDTVKSDQYTQDGVPYTWAKAVVLPWLTYPVWVGPVRNGRLYGESIGHHYWRQQSISFGNPNITAATLALIGFAGDGLWNWTGTGDTPLATITQLPWILELGCVRTARSVTTITWPEIREHVYQSIGPVSNTVTNTPLWYLDPDVAEHRHDITSIRVGGTGAEVIDGTGDGCIALQDEERYASYWQGDDQDGSIAAPRAPQVVIWTHDERFAIQATSGKTSQYEDRYASLSDRYTWWYGWLSGSPQGTDDVTLDGVDVLILDGDIGDGTETEFLNSLGDLSTIRNWLDTGNKLLVIANAYCVNGILGSPTISDYGLLAELGSSMSIGSRHQSPFGGTDGWRLELSDHELAQGPLESEGPTPSVWQYFVVGEIDGGDWLARARFYNGVYPDTPLIADPGVFLAVEELASGSAILLSAIQYLDGGFDSDSNGQSIPWSDLPTYIERAMELYL